jgi:hypothetical protein
MDQAINAIRSILHLIPEDQQREAIRQICRELGLQQLDVPRMYTDHEVAARYQVHVRTVRGWITGGRLRGCQIDRKWYSRADWLDEFERKEVTTA